MRFLSAMFAAAASLAACGGRAETIPTASLTASCARLHAAVERNDRECLGEYAETPAAGAFVASCVGLARAEGSLVTPADLDACAASLEGCRLEPVRCVGTGNDLLFPNHEKAGTKPPGEPCVAALQCKSAQCKSRPDSADGCGRCLATKGSGEACNVETDSCAAPTECLAGRCSLSGLGEGAACIDYGGGGCAVPYFCEVAAADDLHGICARRGAPGATCGPKVPCADGVGCVAGTCRPPLPDGAACDASRDSCGGTRSSACVAGTCATPRTGRGEGEACDPDRCRADLRCTNHLCTRLGALGGPCELDQLCAGRADCSATPEGPRCTSRPAAGTACTVAGLCAAGARCVGFHALGPDDRGTCRAVGDLGETCPCAEALACAQGRCVARGDDACR